MAEKTLRSDSLVLRNSLWIGLQPLVINVISIFVMGYVARTLGQEDYGKFVFAFAFVAMLMPIGNMGLRAVTVRDIAADREIGLSLLGRIFTLRLILALFAMLLLVILVNAMGKPSLTKLIVYIAGTTLLTHTAATTLFDIFQAYERMQYIAISNFVSGTLLTISSVVVLMLGFRLVGLTVVYASATVILFLVILGFYLKFFPLVRLQIDKQFWVENLKKGFPFFVTGMLGALNLRIGIIFLSWLSGDAAAGQYGASFKLVERLNVIAESLCFAIFPTISLLFAASKMEELNDLLRRYANYMLMLALPIAVGTTILSSEIVGLIYGDQYANSGPVLAVLAWNLPGFFFALLLGYCLGAIHRQSVVVRYTLIATPVNVALNLLLIPFVGAIGAAIAYACYGLVASVAMFFVMRKELGFHLGRKRLLLIVVANVLMGACAWFLKGFHWTAAVAGGAISYALLLIALRVVRRDDWQLIRSAVFNRGAKEVPEAPA